MKSLVGYFCVRGQNICSIVLQNVAGELSQTEEHNAWLEQSEQCFEHGLPLVIFPNLDVVVPPAYIELCKQGFSLEMVDNATDEGERICISDSPGIECTVVHNGVQFSVFLGSVKDRRSVGGI